MPLLSELKRRNVIRMAGLYLVGAWLITQVVATLLPTFDAPTWVLRVIVLVLAIGFVPALVFAWVYEITPEGIRRESDVAQSASITPQTGRRMDRAIMVVLALVFVVYAIDRFVLLPKREVAHDAALRTEMAAAPAKQDKADSRADEVPNIERDPSIAVLPMVNMSEDKANEFFSDGISEELLNLLAKVPQLRVIARTSSFSFKGKDTPIADIARVLHVASVLEGSVRKSGDKVRITAQLIRASDGSHLWSETYDRTLDDIFKVQDEIAAAVVTQLKIKLLGAAPAAKPVDPKAYPLLLQAQALSDQQSKAGREQAVSLYKQALEISPNEARAWAGLARIYFNQAVFEGRLSERIAWSREAANKALAIDPDNVIAIGALGRIASDVEFDLPAATRYFQRAVDLEPENLVVLNAVAILLQDTDRVDEGIRLQQYRVDHDPTNPTAYYNLGIALYCGHKWDAAVDAFRAAVRLSPDAGGVPGSLGISLLLGHHDAADALKACEADSDEASRLQCSALALHTLGRTKDADAAQQAFVEKYGSDQPGFAATMFAYRGNTDAAFEWLHKAVAAHDPQVATVRNDPLFDALHGDARWEQLLRTLNLTPEQLAKIELKVKLPGDR